ncbi:hypothetical protein [Arthrobacter agilis]|uniref:hypothetical protein n=1 Tax=Arthrobacter agilis TaxID=37921 RepID=UPI00278A9A67|nr:hypothetical protein [Arthrobacter agilis]MDQ0736554.1 hypothetical protein [Arthrobacter agilis]
MKVGVKQYLAGLVLLFLSTLFIPQAVSDFARTESSGGTVPAEAPVLLAVGIVIVLAAAACIGWGYWLTHRTGAPRKRNPEDDPDEPLLRPGYAPETPERDAWREHPLRRPDRGADGRS